jgi:hypothetical protein
VAEVEEGVQVLLLIDALLQHSFLSCSFSDGATCSSFRGALVIPGGMPLGIAQPCDLYSPVLYIYCWLVLIDAA